MSVVVFRGRFSNLQPRILRAGLANLSGFQVGGIAIAAAAMIAIALTAADRIIFEKQQGAILLPVATEAERLAELPVRPPDLAPLPDVRSLSAPATSREENAALGPVSKDQARLQEDLASRDISVSPAPGKRDLSYLRYYIYSELPPTEKPADLVLASLKDTPPGSSIDEIRHASNAFGLDFIFMKAIAKIESGFDPKQHTGSYIGLFQLSKYEFGLYGSGDILDARDNAVAAAYKFLAEAALFEWHSHKKPTFIDLYMIHQQGWQGAAEHVLHPERLAWKSMCATGEGQEKGEKWCKRAVWGNTLPSVKHVWKSVEHLTSAAFVTMWRERIELFYTRYSEATNKEDGH
jgi:soluble lytic murein transglycosylase-like protein